jgi:hypothetical protein
MSEQPGLQDSVAVGEGSHGPTWETESPASSINWSMENAPVLMSSLSRATAAAAPIVYIRVGSSVKPRWSLLWKMRSKIVDPTHLESHC